jgi:hypothetical protein
MAGHTGLAFGQPECKLDPAIHVCFLALKDVDARPEAGHDGETPSNKLGGLK